MTTKELNRDIKKLKRSVDKMKTSEHTNDQWFEFIEKQIKPEFIRLYNADNTMKALNADSLRIMLRLNVRFRFINFHSFGLMIED